MAETLVWVTTPRCNFCNNTAQVELTQEEYANVNAGMLMQLALPARDAAFRELLISGTHEHCWASFMTDEDEL